MSPYELGESGNEAAIPFLIAYLQSSQAIEKRLAASALTKLNKNHSIDISLAKPYLLNNCSDLAPQTRQYSLNAIIRLLPQLTTDEIENIYSNLQHEDKEYNKKLIRSVKKKWNQIKNTRITKSLREPIISPDSQHSPNQTPMTPVKPVSQESLNKLGRGKIEELLLEQFKMPGFHDDQWKTISAILRGKRVLLIQKTGYGKSLCFQFPANNFDGTTIVFSPLIALMRDQVNALQLLGIQAACINSNQENERNREIINKAKAGKYKLLYIAPERQENQFWQEAVREINISMVVVDEAHCISVWGHDFRPSYRRIINLVNQLPQDFPVLAVTATATTRTAKDIQHQIGSNTIQIRGNLMRDNFHLSVIHTDSQEAKLAYMVEFINEQPGTGLMYTGTRVNAEVTANWLRFNNIDAVHYHAGLTPEQRQAIEIGLKTNKWKCIVSTNALGMGMDKPDLRFLIHTQIPQSPTQ